MSDAGVVRNGLLQTGISVSTLFFVRNVFAISISLFGKQVLSNSLEKVCNVLDGRLGAHLEGNGVENFFSEIFALDLLELVEYGEGCVIRLLEEHCVRESQVQD